MLHFALNDFGTLERASVQDVHAVTLIALGNDSLSIVDLYLLDGIEDDIELLLIQSIEHESLQELGLQLVLDLCRFGEDGRSEIFLSVISSEDLC